MTADGHPGRPAPETATSLSEGLKAAIRGRGLTAYSLARMANTRPHVVQRFLNGERGLTLATADKLAGALGLELTPRGPRPRLKNKKTIAR